MPTRDGGCGEWRKGHEAWSRLTSDSKKERRVLLAENEVGAGEGGDIQGSLAHKKLLSPGTVK